MEAAEQVLLLLRGSEGREENQPMIMFWKNKDFGILLLRVFIAVRLIYGVLDNVLHWDRMIEFKDFLQQNKFPIPLICAIVSVYAQLIAGILILVGLKIRWAAAVMIINFLVAIIMVHLGQTFEQMTPALAMLFSSLMFFFTGAGKYSLDGEPLGHR